VLDKALQFFIEFAYIFRVATVVHAYEEAVVLRLGKFHRTLEPGWHWVIPLRVEEVISTTVTCHTTNLPTQTLETSDNVQVSVAALVTWEVSDVRKFLLEAAEHQEAVFDAATGTLATLVMSLPWKDLRGTEFSRTLKTDVKKRARRYGVRITDVQLTDLARTKTIRLLQPTAPAAK
jgi:regulator of protease activity HflC (stomatin/prohibitin superfamily)